MWLAKAKGVLQISELEYLLINLIWSPALILKDRPVWPTYATLQSLQANLYASKDNV